MISYSVHAVDNYSICIFIRIEHLNKLLCTENFQHLSFQLHPNFFHNETVSKYFLLFHANEERRIQDLFFTHIKMYFIYSFLSFPLDFFACLMFFIPLKYVSLRWTRHDCR